MALKKTIKRLALFFLCLLGGCEQPIPAVSGKEHVVISSSGTHYLGRLVVVEFENHKWIFVSGTESANTVGLFTRTKMKVVAISDTHTYHRSCTPPDGDILIHAGDFTIYGEPDEVLIFNQWLGELPHKHKIVIAGNHDLGFEREPKRFRKMITNAIYLQDKEITIDGLRIYGAPWTPKYGDWAFMPPRGSIELKEKWAKIPKSLDILVTHGPPYGVCDLIEGYSGGEKWRENVGCALLRDAILAKKPRFAICGHVHYSNGSKWLGDTKIINAAICDESYAPVQPAQVFDIEPVTN